jgi:hypothetical protein
VSSEVLHSTRSRPFGSRRRTKRRKSSPGIALNDTNEVSGEALMRSSCSHALPADACGARARDPSHLALCSASLACSHSDYLCLLSQQTSQTEGAAGGGRSSPAPGNGEHEVTSAWACALMLTMLTCSPCWRLPRARSPCWRLPCALPDFLLGALARDPSHDFLLVVAVAPLFPLILLCVSPLSRALTLTISVCSRAHAHNALLAGACRARALPAGACRTRCRTSCLARLLSRQARLRVPLEEDALVPRLATVNTR